MTSKLSLHPCGPAIGTDEESSIIDIRWSGIDGVTFVVQCGEQARISYSWTGPARYCLLEEGDLAEWFSSDSWSDVEGSGLYEVSPGALLPFVQSLDGAWLPKDPTSDNASHREWFICTSNWNALVVSTKPPVIEEFTQGY